MRNWPLFKAPKKPIVIDFFSWMEDPFEKAIKEKVEIGWVGTWCTRPYLELPSKPLPVPFNLSMISCWITTMLSIDPMSLPIQPYYREFDFNLDAPSADDNPASRYINF